MNNDFNKMLSRVYELEGLLLVIERHGAETPAVVMDMLREKAAQVHEMAGELELPVAQATEVVTPAEPHSEPSVAEAAQEATAQEPVAEEAPAAEPEPATEPEPVVTPPVFTPAPKPVVVEQTEVEIEPVEESPAEPEAPYIPESPYAPKPEGYEAPSPAEVDDEPADNDYEEAEEADDEQTENVRVDEQLQRRLSKDLSRAFSINDRFRFRRELFANSELDMRDALNMVETMHSVDEAEDYFYNDLGWDAESPEVADFMTIIKNHFL